MPGLSLEDPALLGGPSYEPSQVLFEYRFPAPPSLVESAPRLILLLLPVIGLALLSWWMFGGRWLTFGVLAVFAAFAGDQWLRFVRAKTRIRIAADGALLVDHWNGRTLEWLPLLKELALGQFRHAVRYNRAGMAADAGTGYELILRTEAGAAKHIRLPGGRRFSPGSGPLMGDSDADALIAAASVFTVARRE